jgi:molybdopterin converting factor small subunit
MNEPLRVQVKLFATLAARRAGAPAGVPFGVELPAGATLADLAQRLDLPADAVKVIFVNGRARPLDWKLNPDDAVGIFPPIGGG